MSIHPWKLYFDGLACIEGQGVDIVLISPIGAIFETSVRLEYFCTNNQAEYEALLLGLQILDSMGVKHVEAFGDSLLVVQQVSGNYQCFDGSLNVYLDKCLEIIAILDDFTIHHVPRGENSMANDLAQRASGFRRNQGKLYFLEKPEVPVCQSGSFGFHPMRAVEICSDESGLAKPEVPVSDT